MSPGDCKIKPPLANERLSGRVDTWRPPILAWSQVFPEYWGVNYLGKSLSGRSCGLW